MEMVYAGSLFALFTFALLVEACTFESINSNNLDKLTGAIDAHCIIYTTTHMNGLILL